MSLDQAAFLARIRANLPRARIDGASHGGARATEPRNADAGAANEPGSDAERCEALLDQLGAQLRRQSAAFVRAASADVPAAIATWLADAGLQTRLRRGDDPRLAALPWATAPKLDVDIGSATPNDPAGLSHADAAIADTGTLVMTSGAANPTSLMFLPETHIVLVREDAVVATLGEALAAISNGARTRGMARAVTLVSGPSRTGDIGGRIVLGAHGPRRLLVVCYR